ncbi:MAG: VanZ family protein [Candidatus Weimeria sp.]
MKKKFNAAVNVVLFAIYLAALIYILFLNGRGLVWSNASFKEYCEHFVNFIPLWSISSYIVKVSSGQLSFTIAVRNIFGNFLMFVPLAYFVYRFNRPTVRRYTLILLIILVLIEILQLLLRVGSCDIDDVILGLSGSVLAYWIICAAGARVSEKSVTS